MTASTTDAGIRASVRLEIVVYTFQQRYLKSATALLVVSAQPHRKPEDVMIVVRCSVGMGQKSSVNVSGQVSPKMMPEFTDPIW